MPTHLHDIHISDKGLTKALLPSQIASLAVIVVVCFMLFPLAEVLSLICSLAVCYLASRCSLKLLGIKSPGSEFVFLAISLGSAILMLLNIWQWTYWGGGSMTDPILHADDSKYFNWALHYCDGSVALPKVEFPGYPALIWCLWKLFGVSFIWPMALNYLALLVSIVLAGGIAVRLLDGKVSLGRNAVACMAMALTATQFYFLSQGIRLQKEALIYLSVALVAYAMAGLAHTKTSFRWADVLLFLFGAALMAVMRTTWMYFILLAVLFIFAGKQWRTNKGKVAVIVFTTLLFFVIGSLYARNPATYSHPAIISGGEVMQEQFVRGNSQGLYKSLLGNYFFAPLWQRIAMLPVTAAVQFIIPFPWLPDGEPVMVDTVLPRINIVWYVVGMLSLFYYIFMAWRNTTSIGTWLFWPAVSYVIIAVLTAGSVSRYVLPFIPLFTVFAIYTVFCAKTPAMKLLLKWWCIAVFSLLAAALVLCFLLQNGMLKL